MSEKIGPAREALASGAQMPPALPQPSLSDRITRVAAFRDPAVVAAYRHRPPYPPETVTILQGLVAAGCPVVLDVGCGTGNLARPLAPLVARVDALDVSPAMLAEGQRLPGGEHPHLHWLLGRAEDAELDPPYGLVTAGMSLHWMDAGRVLPRFKRLLVPGGFLAIVGTRLEQAPWSAALRELRHPGALPMRRGRGTLLRELTARGLFALRGERLTAPIVVACRVEDYITGLHSRSGLASQQPTPAAARRFDAEVRRLLEPASTDGWLRLRVRGWVAWGEPCEAAPA